MAFEIEIAKIILAFMVLINPFSALPLYLDLTRGYAPKDRRKVAQIAALSVFVTIAVFALSGNFILKLFGISTGAFQVSGGILVFLIAVSMVSGGSNIAKPDIGTSEESEIQITPDRSNLVSTAVVPIAIPMMIGPGGMSTVVVYTSTARSWVDIGMVMVAGALIALICLVSLLLAGKISRFLGETGLTILNRIMGMLLAAVAVEIVLSGMKALFPSLVILR